MYQQKSTVTQSATFLLINDTDTERSKCSNITVQFNVLAEIFCHTKPLHVY